MQLNSIQLERLINKSLKSSNKLNSPLFFNSIEELTFFISTLDESKETATFFDKGNNVWYNLYYNNTTKDFSIYKNKQFIKRMSAKDFEGFYFENTISNKAGFNTIFRSIKIFINEVK